MAVVHAFSDDRVVLPTESHRAAQSPPVLRDYMAGSLKHLPRQEIGTRHKFDKLRDGLKTRDRVILSFGLRLSFGLSFQLWIKVRDTFKLQIRHRVYFKLRIKVRFIF